MKKSPKLKTPLARNTMASEAGATRSGIPTVVPAMRSAVSTNSLADQQRPTTTSHQPDAKERKERQMRRLTADYEELRSKLERDKTEALNTQKEAMNRAFRVQLAKLLKEKEELVRKVQTLQQAKDAHLCAHNCKSIASGTNAAAGAPSGSSGSPACTAAVEVQKLTHENSVLRIEKKKQEEQLQMMKESEQHRFENMRSLLDDKARELTMLQKQLRQQIARLREESKAKDRVISHLEAELRVQSGRAQQFRDIIEQSLLSASGNARNGQVSNDELIARERRLQIQLEDLRETLRQQQETFAQEKRDLLRRLSETERQQGPLRQKSKQYLARNLHLAAKNHQLVDALEEKNAPASEPETSGSDPKPGVMTSDLKRSLTRPNVNQLTCPVASEKQRRIEYVQQIQKLRKEQRYYSMWELPPLLEVETDGHGNEGSEGSLSPAATSGVTSCSSDSAWSEETRRELEMLFSQLSREHSDLQRNYQMLHEKLHQLTCFSESDANNVNYATLLADYKAARARIRDLEEILQLKNAREREASDEARNGQPPLPRVPSLLEIQAKFVREKHAMQTQLALLARRLDEANHRHQAAQAELNEARDQNELLEFRILELEESQDRAPLAYTADHPDRKDVCTDTDSDDLSVGDSGIVSLNSLMVDCPSPTLHSSSSTSPDSDYLSEKISTVKGELQLMVSSLSDPSQKTVLAQLQALLGVCQSRLAHKAHHAGTSGASSDHHWEWQLQESGIFEEDHRHHADAASQTEPESVHASRISEQDRTHRLDASSQTETEPLRVRQNGDVSIRVTIPLPLASSPVDKETQVDRREAVDSRAVQTAVEVSDSQVQCDPVVEQCKTFEHQAVQASVEPPTFADQVSQTDESVMTIADFRDVESYYLQQIELLQKEKMSHRKKFQASREETQQALQQLELLGKQFQERERQFEEILQKNCRAFERELELARNEHSAELATLKECLHLVWHEVKDYATVSDVPRTSVMEFTRALIDALHDVCTELGSLRVRIVQLAEMEQAFQTTLQQADGLVHHIEEKHLSRIRELEQTEQELRHQLEQQRRFEDDGEESLEIKIIELEQKNDVLAVQAGKCQELEDYCQQLHGRLEEYEQRERSFQMAVQEVERRCSAREQRLREEVESLRQELERCRESETSWRHRLEQREGQLSIMRSELEIEQKTIANLEAELKDLQSKLEKDDTSFRNEVTKLRSQLNISMAQLNELESLNCQLREQVAEYQDQIVMLQRSLEKESSQSQELVAENNRLMQVQLGMMMNSVPVGKPLTEELFEVESDEGCPSAPPVADEDSSGSVDITVGTTLDDFSEISLPNTPTVVDGCKNVFEEHFKVLESLESYLETQQIANLEDNDESGISTSPSLHENETVALLEAQLSQLRTEKHFLLNSVVNSQKKDEIIQILIDQLKYNAPRQYLLETASQIRKIVAIEEAESGQNQAKDKDIDRVCQLLEAPVDLIKAAECNPVLQQPSPSPSNCSNADVNNSMNKVVRRQTTVTVLPEEDPLLSQPSDLRITRKVGQDGLVIAWLPSSDSDCVGYLICVNGQEAQRVRNVQRTKAVLCGLNLQSEMEICIYSLSADGLVSSPAVAHYRPGEEEGDCEIESGQSCETASPRDVVVQTFYTNSSVTIRSSRRLSNPAGAGTRIPVRSRV